MTTDQTDASVEDAVAAAEAEAERAEARLAQSAARLRSHVSDAAQDTGRLLRDGANTRVSGVFDSAAERMEQTADALGGDRGDAPHNSSDRPPLGDLSEFLEATARDLRDADLDTVTRYVGEFSRARPLTFLASAAAIGFAAGRLALASDTSGRGRLEPNRGPDEMAPPPPEPEESAPRPEKAPSGVAE